MFTLNVRTLLRSLVPAAALLMIVASTAAADPGGPPAPDARAPQPKSSAVSPFAGAAQVAPQPPPAPPPPLKVGRPTTKLLIREGQAGRLLLGGTWYFRLDDLRVGLSQRFQSQRSLQGWQEVGIPHNWNAQDFAFNMSSVGWYRKEFTVPRMPRGTPWVVRFEGVNHFATVFLNGRKIAEHAGGYLPFEAQLKGLRRGRNRLVVRASTLRSPTDLTHARPAKVNGFGTGGWWNFGGLLREVYVRPVRGLDVEGLTALPTQRCTRCAARVKVRMQLRNATRRKALVRLTLRVGKDRTIRFVRAMDASSRREVGLSFTIPKPQLWRPGKGKASLYGLGLSATAPGGLRAGYRTSFGVRRIFKRADGRVFLNGRALQLRGVSFHEDHPLAGAAWRPAHRRETLAEIAELGASVVRVHYPMHPAMLEALDRRGILVWSQAPVYQIRNDRMEIPSLRARAVQANREMVLRDSNHPSIFAWSMANELQEPPIGPGQARFITTTAREIRKLDRTRLVAIDRVDRLNQPEGHPALRSVDALGVNEYYGWYNGTLPPAGPSTTQDLGPRLDALHATYPDKALFVTEFGAESTFDGPEGQKGTFLFQSRYVREHLEIQASRPFVNGSMVWALRDFRVHPTWGGGNPFPQPPYNHKGLIEESGARKPAFFEAQRIMRATPPLR